MPRPRKREIVMFVMDVGEYTIHGTRLVVGCDNEAGCGPLAADLGLSIYVAYSQMIQPSCNDTCCDTPRSGRRRTSSSLNNGRWHVCSIIIRLQRVRLALAPSNFAVHSSIACIQYSGKGRLAGIPFTSYIDIIEGDVNVLARRTGCMHSRVARFQRLCTLGAGFHLIPRWTQRFRICKRLERQQPCKTGDQFRFCLLERTHL